MNLFKTCIIIPVMFLGCNLSAQEIMNLSLDSAINFSLYNNITLINAEYNIRSAKQDIKELNAGGLPQVEANIDYSNFLGYKMEFKLGGGEVTFTDEEKMVLDPGDYVVLGSLGDMFGSSEGIEMGERSNATLQVSQLLFSGNFIVGRKLAKMAHELCGIQYNNTRQDVIAQASSAYYMVLITKEMNEILRRTLDNMRQIYNKTEALVKVGMLEKTDIDQLSVQVTLLENSFDNAKKQLVLAENMLKLQLNMKSDATLNLTDSLDNIVQRFDYAARLKTSFRIENNYRYQLILKQEDMLEKQVQLKKAGYLPTLAAFYQHNEKLIVSGFDMTPPNVLGLSLKIPIFSSGMRKAQVEKAKIQFENNQKQKEFLAEQLLVQEKQLKFNLETAINQYASQKKNVEVAERVFNSIKLKYEQGILSSLDLSTANNNHLQAQSNYIQSLMQLLEAENSLRKLYCEL